MLNGKANVSHNHDTVYSKLNHKHDDLCSAEDIQDLETTLRGLIAGKAESTQITSLYNRFNALATEFSELENELNGLSIPDQFSDLENDMGLVDDIYVQDYVARQLEEAIGNIDFSALATKLELANRIAAVNETLATKVDREVGKSLVLNTEIAKIHEHENMEELNKFEPGDKEALDQALLDIQEAKDNRDSLQEEIDELRDDLDILNGDEYTEGSMIKTVKEEVAALVDSAPEAMNTINKLAQSINDNKDIYDIYVESNDEKIIEIKTKNTEQDNTIADILEKDEEQDLAIEDIKTIIGDETAGMLKDIAELQAMAAEPNVQADWNETDETSDAFIQNKPSLALRDMDNSDGTGYAYFTTKTYVDEAIAAATGTDMSLYLQKTELLAGANEGLVLSVSNVGGVLNFSWVEAGTLVTESQIDDAFSAVFGNTTP